MKGVYIRQIVLLGAMAAAATGCGSRNPKDVEPVTASAGAREPAVRQASAAAGRVRGAVRLKGTPPAPAYEPVAKDQDVCGSRVPITRLTIGADNGVRNAFVYLVDAPASEPARPRAAVAVNQSRCEYAPRAIRVPLGTQIEIANGDPILHNVHAREMSPDGLRTIFNIAQPMRGQRTLVDLPLTKPGIVTLTCEAGHPWMTAYMLVANHPYTAVTAEDGTFAIDGIPPGAYQIRMWHEGVRLKNVFRSVQQYEYEEPYEVTRDVVVTPGGEVQLDFSLELRGAGTSS